jgi:hypothetical protein
MTYHGYTRRCVLCLKSRPMAGGKTSSDGKRFVCAECQAKRAAAPRQIPQAGEGA